jgi:hypothetical protein
MATIRAYVYKETSGIDSYKVYPAIVVLGKNDKFELVNVVDDHDAFLTIPKDPFEGGPIKEEKVSPRGRSSQKTPKNTLIAVEYQVKVSGKKASGNSDPVIIIDP